MARMTEADDAAGGPPPAVSRADPPLYEVVLWPNRSLGRRGFAAVMGFAGVMLSLPLIPLIGSKVALGLAPFLLAAWAGLGAMIRRNIRDGRLTERLALWPDLIAVERTEPRGRVLRWQAHPHWVRLTLHRGAKLENYLTLRGAGREIELGAFLSPEERAALAEQLTEALNRARAVPPPAGA